MSKRITIEGVAGQRLDRLVAEALPGTSRRQAKRWIDGRRVWVNGRVEIMASRVLRGGERVEVEPEAPPEPAEPPEIPVVWEDDRLLAVNKPPGIPSGPTRDPRRNHVEGVLAARRGSPLVLVHRLDLDTTGALLLAKTPEAGAGLARLFRERRVEKTYLALVEGEPPGTFHVVSHLREGQGRVHVVRSGGLRAETRFETLARGGGVALVAARPRTGRMHQIRIQLAREGFPILGDPVYGGPNRVGDLTVHRQMLHALALRFPHPATGEPLRIVAPPPEDFRAAARKLLGPAAWRRALARVPGEPGPG
ncbi:RluA family pseudouridine synthase [Deferrisoma sp.]